MIEKKELHLWHIWDSGCGWLEIHESVPAPKGSGVSFVVGDTICTVENKDKAKERAIATEICKAHNREEVEK